MLSAIATLALAGCATSCGGNVVSDAARAARAATRLSEKAMRTWCPAAVANGGRRLSQRQARDCLRRAWDGWLGELKRNGYDPNKVAEGK